jgi:hypothetical protein
MEGSIFRLKREEIEGIYKDTDLLIMKKSIPEAKKKLNKAQKKLDDLSTKDLCEIQERSLFNLRIKWDNLAANIDKTKAKR